MLSLVEQILRFIPFIAHCVYTYCITHDAVDKRWNNSPRDSPAANRSHLSHPGQFPPHLDRRMPGVEDLQAQPEIASNSDDSRQSEVTAQEFLCRHRGHKTMRTH